VNEDKYKLPEGWLWTTVSQVAEIITGNTPSKSDKSNYGGFLPWVKPPQLDSENPIKDTPEKLSKKGAKFARILPKDSVLVSCIGLLGKVGLAGCELATNQQINSLIFSNIVLPRYGYYYCRSKYFKDWLQSEASATTLSIVNKGRFSEVPIPLPPFNEQKRIVQKIENLFVRLTKTKQELSKILSLLKKFRQSALAKAFSGDLTKEWREQQEDLEPALKLLERIREERKKKLGKKYKEAEPIDISDLPELPEGWKWAQMGECCLVNPRHPSDILPSDAQVSFVPMPAIDAEVGAIIKLETKPLKKVIKGFTHFINGDVLFAKITPCMENGKAAIAKNLVNGVGCGTTELHVLRPLGAIFSEYIYYYIRQQSFRDRAEANMTGTAGQLRVPVDFIKNEILPLSSLQEQKEIVNKIQDFFAQADTIEKSVKIAQTHCEKLAKSILAKAFRGELVEQDPNDEPAERLLKELSAKRRG